RGLPVNDLGEPGGLDLGEPGADSGGGSGLELSSPAPEPAPAGLGLDLGDSLELGSPGADSDGGSGGGDKPLSLDGLDLAAPSVGSSAPGSGLALDDDFEGLELGTGSGGGDKPDGDGVVSFGKSKKSAKSATARKREKRQRDDGPIELDLSPQDALARPKKTEVAAADARREPQADDDESKKPTSKKKRIVIAAVVAGALAIGGGGYGFMQWQAKSAQAELVKGKLDEARTLLARNQWKDGTAAALAALKADPESLEAMAMAMQGRYAEVIDLGAPSGPARQQASAWASKLTSTTTSSPEISKAQGLRLLVEGKPAEAVKLLNDATVKQPKDANAFLFLGWAHRGAYAYGPAAVAFDKTLKRTPKRLNALYGLARSQMAMGQRENADKTLSAIIELDKNHLGALISKVELAEVNRFGERERRYLELLGREDIGKTDRREVARAWALAGAEALATGRVGEASDRFAKALKLNPGNLAAQVGTARAELAEDRSDQALGLINRVLGLNPGSVDAQLTLAEIRVAKEEYMSALDVVEKVLGRKPPLQDRGLLTRAYMIRGDIFATDKSTLSDAEEDYKAAIESAFEGDIGPVVALSKLYNRIGRGEDAVELLKPVKEAAKSDAALATTLGVAYLGAGDSASAEEWFRLALDQRPDDVDARFQLGMALVGQKKYDDAITTLEAAYRASNEREDIGIRLAVMYEEMGMRDRAYKQYDSLLTRSEKGPDGKETGPSISLRSLAGRFFARIGETDRAAKLGNSILAEQPKNPAGLYLKGEALMAEEKYREASKLFSTSAQNDPQPQFFEGLGRAHEGLGELNPAAKAYARALEGDPNYLEPRLARARIFVTQRRFSKALEELDKASQLAPKNAQIEFFRGKTYVAIKKYDSGITHLSRSVRIDSRPAEPHYQLGVAYYNTDKPSAAAASLGAATSRANGDEAWLVEAFRILGYAQRAAGNRGGAISAWRNYLDRAKPGTREVDEVKRFLMRLQAR
ncbi:MAG: tetratricopeptide repeat protein, partial [Deltaproteobacteria bacterium]|nr:tetratricopeptide repeat protein [Deltaproteobacteria bacterium]